MDSSDIKRIKISQANNKYNYSFRGDDLNEWILALYYLRDESFNDDFYNIKSLQAFLDDFYNTNNDIVKLIKGARVSYISNQGNVLLLSVGH
ncbi:hypothetical protein [Mycoplasma sp. Z1473D]